MYIAKSQNSVKKLTERYSKEELSDLKIKSPQLVEYLEFFSEKGYNLFEADLSNMEKLKKNGLVELEYLDYIKSIEGKSSIKCSELDVENFNILLYRFNTPSDGSLFLLKGTGKILQIYGVSQRNALLEIWKNNK